jgi:hypothetical protein
VWREENKSMKRRRKKKKKKKKKKGECAERLIAILHAEKEHFLIPQFSHLLFAFTINPFRIIPSLYSNYTQAALRMRRYMS